MAAKFSKSIVKKIIRLYHRQGLSSRDVAQVLGVSQPTVLRYAREAGVNRPISKTNSLPKKIHVQAVKHYESGMSAKKVASLLSISKTTVLGLVKAAGITRTLSETRGIYDETKLFAINLYQQGMSTRAVAEIVGVDHGTVLSLVTKANINRSMSEAAALNAAMCGTRGCRGVRSTFSSKKTSGCLVRLDSLFERARILQLDHDPTVNGIARAIDRISYGKGKCYVADLKVVCKNGKIRIEEVKPAYQLNNYVVVQKAKAAELFYASRGIDYCVVTEYEIGKENFDRIDPLSLTDEREKQIRISLALNAIRYGLKRKRDCRNILK